MAPSYELNWLRIAKLDRGNEEHSAKAGVVAHGHQPGGAGGNHLEALKRGRQGQHSVRINDWWRICFQWTENDAYAVEIVDYH